MKSTKYLPTGEKIWKELQTEIVTFQRQFIKYRVLHDCQPLVLNIFQY